MTFGELIPILPNIQLALRIINSGWELSPDYQPLQELAQLYIRSFEDWGQDLVDAQGNNLALNYLLDYGKTHHGVILMLEYQGRVIGGGLMGYGDRETIARALIENIAESYEHPLRFRYNRFDNAHYNFLHHKLLHDENAYFAEISDIFYEEKEILKKWIAFHLDYILTDLSTYQQGYPLEKPPLSKAGEVTLNTVASLIQSFVTSRRLRASDKNIVHDIYRLYTLCLFVASFVYVQEESRFPFGAVTCVQWTCLGTPMDRIFRMLCGKRSKRIASIFDSSLPLLGRIANKLPGDQNLINAIVNLGKNSEIVWEGVIGDGSRPKNETYDYNAISLTKFPFDGLIALVYDWNTYNFIVRRRYLRLVWRRRKARRPLHEGLTSRAGNGRRSLRPRFIRRMAMRRQTSQSRQRPRSGRFWVLRRRAQQNRREKRQRGRTLKTDKLRRQKERRLRFRRHSG